MRTTVDDRDNGVRRLRRATTVTLAAAGALVVAVAGLAARALPGRHTVTSVKATTTAPSRQATPPPLVAVESQVTPSAPSSPSSPPVPSQAPPVVVSGGT
jgi:hypothetical protein